MLFTKIYHHFQVYMEPFHFPLMYMREKFGLIISNQSINEIQKFLIRKF